MAWQRRLLMHFNDYCVCSWQLTRMSYKKNVSCRALAKNCNAPLDAKKGAEAKDWKGGKPVRVVRNCKGRKHSEYAPDEGNRYDGLYKVRVMDKLDLCGSVCDGPYWVKLE